MDTVESGRCRGRQPVPAQEESWTPSYRPEAPAEARRLTKEALRRWQVPAVTADGVLLVVSELVTNALEYARPPIVLHVDRDRGTGQVRVEVTDGGPAPPSGNGRPAAATANTAGA